jgi:hypothetical protein
VAARSAGAAGASTEVVAAAGIRDALDTLA